MWVARLPQRPCWRTQHLSRSCLAEPASPAREALDAAAGAGGLQCRARSTEPKPAAPGLAGCTAARSNSACGSLAPLLGDVMSRWRRSLHGRAAFCQALMAVLHCLMAALPSVLRILERVALLAGLHSSAGGSWLVASTGATIQPAGRS